MSFLFNSVKNEKDIEILQNFKKIVFAVFVKFDYLRKRFSILMDNIYML